MKTIRLFAAGTLAFLAPLLPGTAQAAPYCIDNNTEFQQVVNDLYAEPIFYFSVDLRFRPGTYSLPADTHPGYFRLPVSGQFVATYAFNLSGGWNAGCTVQATPGTGATIIDGLGTKSIFEVLQQSGANEANVTMSSSVSQIEFRNYKNFAVNFAAGSANAALDVRHSIFRTGVGTAIYGPALFLHNSLFEGNRMPTGTNFLVGSPGDLTAAMYNNTFRGNTVQKLNPTTGPNDRNYLISLGRPGDTTSGTAIFENNIVDSTTLCANTCLLIGTDSNARIRYNILDPALIDGTPLFNTGNLNINPLFAGSSGGGLNANSPARDLGRTAAMNGVATDLGGGARVQGGVVDLGAYELAPVAPDMVFLDGFD